VPGSDINNGRATFGVTAGAMGAGIVGGEVDFGYNPSFFGTKNDFGNNTVINLMVGRRTSGLRVLRTSDF
jgi:hypothetical protein